MEMFRFVKGNVSEFVQLWTYGREIQLDTVYKYVRNNKCVAVWMDFEKLSEVRMKRIFKKMEILPHEFFMYHYDTRTRIGWRVKK